MPSEERGLGAEPYVNASQTMYVFMLPSFPASRMLVRKSNVSSISNLSRTWHIVCLHPVRSSVEHAWVDLPDIVLIHILQMVLAMA